MVSIAISAAVVLVQAGMLGLPSPSDSWAAPPEPPVVVAPTSGADDVLPIPKEPRDSGTWTPVDEHRGEPVRWNPCEPISYAVSTHELPDDGEMLVHEVVAEVLGLSGLQFDYVGMTDELPKDDDRAMAADLVVVWSGMDQGDVWKDRPDSIGLASSWTREGRIDNAVIHIRTDVSYTDYPGVLRHEFGHAVGLGHVEDPGEVMMPGGSSRSGFGPGDRRGLWELGAQAGCLEDRTT